MDLEAVGRTAEAIRREMGEPFAALALPTEKQPEPAYAFAEL